MRDEYNIRELNPRKNPYDEVLGDVQHLGK